MKKRVKNDIWKGLYDFYLIEDIRGLQPFTLLQDGIIAYINKFALKVEKSTSTYVHQLTHQRLHTFFFIYTQVLIL